MTEERTIYVTDAGSVRRGGVLYHPGDKIPLTKFKGYEAALRELVEQGKLSTRPRRMRTDTHGRVIKVDRSSEAPALPHHLDDNDKSRKELNPLRSRVDNAVATAELARLEKEQRDDEAAQPVAVKTREPAKEPEPEQGDSSEEDLAAIVESVNAENDDFEDLSDDMPASDEELLRELALEQEQSPEKKA